MGRKKHKIANNINSILEEKYLVDEIVSLEDLQIKYEMYDSVEDEDLKLIRDYYLEEERDNIIIIEIEDGKIKKRKITIPSIKNMVCQEVYERQFGVELIADE